MVTLGQLFARLVRALVADAGTVPAPGDAALKFP
jgi:hypothetical protein